MTRMRCIKEIGYCEPGKWYMVSAYSAQPERPGEGSAWLDGEWQIKMHFEPEHASFDNALDKLLE